MFENISGFTCPLHQMVVAKFSVQGHACSWFNQQPGRLKQSAQSQSKHTFEVTALQQAVKHLMLKCLQLSAFFHYSRDNGTRGVCCLNSLLECSEINYFNMFKSTVLMINVMKVINIVNQERREQKYCNLQVLSFSDLLGSFLKRTVSF